MRGSTVPETPPRRKPRRERPPPARGIAKWGDYNRLLTPEQRVSAFGRREPGDDALTISLARSMEASALLANAHLVRRLTEDLDPEERVQDKIALALAPRLVLEQQRKHRDLGPAPKGDPITALLEGPGDETPEEITTTVRAASPEK